MKKLVIIPPAENADPKLIDHLYEKYKYISNTSCIVGKNCNDKNSIGINQVISNGTHSNYIKMIIAPNHFEITKKIADKFCVHTNQTNCLILIEENKKNSKIITDFLDNDKYILCFLVGFQREIYLEFDREVYEFYFENIQSV